MVAPVIGLTTYREQAAYGVWNQRADLLPTEYAEAVTSTGGIPILLPPIGEPGAADVVVARLDGLVISGGADVDPRATAPIRTSAPPPGAPTGTPGRRRCSPPRRRAACRSSVSAAACS